MVTLVLLLLLLLPPRVFLEDPKVNVLEPLLPLQALLLLIPADDNPLLLPELENVLLEGLGVEGSSLEPTPPTREEEEKEEAPPLGDGDTRLLLAE